jgi:hypothetical protein
MKNGFTIIEVSILFVIFLIVAFLVAPLSLDDTMQAKNISRWKNVQPDFVNIQYSLYSQAEDSGENFIKSFDTIIKNEIKTSIKPYKISYMNGIVSNKDFGFENFYITYSNAVLAYKFQDNNKNDSSVGQLLYDVNGVKGPNTWGKDVFGLNLYKTGFEPFGKNETLSVQKQDCSRFGKGLTCSNYYLIGGNFD